MGQQVWTSRPMRVVSALLMMTSMLGAMTIASAFTAPRASAAAQVSAHKGVLGAAKKVRTFTLGSLKQASRTAASAGSPHAPATRARPTARGAASASLRPPSAASSPVSGGGALLNNFDAVNASQNSIATGGFELEPPDESIAVGPAFALNFVNLTGAIYTKQGVTVAGPFSLGALGVKGGFFNTDMLTNIVSDPRAYYDAASHTYFALIWEDDFVDGALGPAYVDLALNSGNPVTGAWTEYQIQVDDASAPGCPCLPDFTILGVDAYNVYLLPNEFQNYGDQGFNGSQIYVLAKSQLLAGVASPNVVHYTNLSMGGFPVYHLQPANEYSSAPAEYFLNSLDPYGTTDNRLGVWAMTNRKRVAQGVIPTLTSTIITSETYAFPPNAITPPGFNIWANQATTGIVATDFDALGEVQFVNGKLYTALDTAINVAGDTATRAGIAWFVVSPSLTSGAISASIVNQGYIASSGLYLMYPHIEATMRGTMAIGFSYGGPNTYLSAAYVTGRPGQGFGAVQTASAGVTTDNGFTMLPAYGGVGRWGDYSAGQLDPTGSGIWFATEYIGPDNPDIYANWSNRVFEVAA